MFKTLKSKVSFVYLCLVIVIAVIGISSVFNLYNLSKSINGLMKDNYKSINAVNKMMEYVNEQRVCNLKYLYYSDEKYIDSFYKNSDKFYKWYNIEANNITEKNEKNYVQNIHKQYVQYLKLSSDLRDIKNKEGTTEAVEFFNSKIAPSFNKLKIELQKLSLLNEKAMFENKHNVTKESIEYMYVILILSTIGVIGGFILSKVFVNKSLYPIYSLTETMKSIKEGHLDTYAPILTEDEIGDLAQEFNNMTTRLLEFEQSTLGKILNEKNKSITIVKSISDPLIVLDNNYKIVLLNSDFEKFFNLKEDAVLNKHFLEGIRYLDLYYHILEMCNDIQKKPNQKIISLSHKGKNYFFNVIVTAIKDNSSNISNVVVLFQNVTELKQLEKIKTDFLYTISHEFKTPLTSIMMGTDLMLNSNVGALNEKQMDIMDAIKEDSDKLSLLVDNLLKLSKIESNQSVFNINPCSIIGIIEQSTKSFYNQAITKDVNLYYEVKENLPKINADYEKISWVINNLISNALKYTNAGDEIKIKAFIKKDKMYVSVEDTGVGIPQEYVNKIFEKFIQVKDNDFEAMGSGLGLAIAKEIINAHNGEIWCESKLDLGSKFTFTLPIIKS